MEPDESRLATLIRGRGTHGHGWVFGGGCARLTYHELDVTPSVLSTICYAQ